MQTRSGDYTFPSYPYLYKKNGKTDKCSDKIHYICDIINGQKSEERNR